MTGIILAAGLGKRLGPLTAERPKALVRVAGRPLIEYQIAIARAAGCGRIVVVGGFGFDDLQRVVTDIDPTIMVVFNPDFDKESLLSLRVGVEAAGDDDIILLDVDYIFAKRYASVFGAPRSETALFCSSALLHEIDVMKVRADDRGHLVELAKTLVDYNFAYLGVAFVPRIRLDAFRRAIGSAALSVGDRGKTEDAYRDYVAAGGTVEIVETGAVDFQEVDTPEDLAQAEAFVKKYGEDQLFALRR